MYRVVSFNQPLKTINVRVTFW